MLKKISTVLIAVCCLFVLPSLLIYPDALVHSKWWAIAGVAVFASLTQPAYSPVDRKAPPEDRGTATQLVWTVYLCLLLGIIECLAFRPAGSVVWETASIAWLAVAMLGACFRAWSVAKLGRFFTWHVRVQTSQKVICDGPYAVVRHPSYTGAWFLYVGMLVAMQAYVGAAFMGMFLLIGFIRRIRYEEELMQIAFGNDYIAYSRRVKRLVPLIW